MGHKFRPWREGCGVCIHNQIRVDSTSTNGPGSDATAPFEMISWSDNQGKA